MSNKSKPKRILTRTLVAETLQLMALIERTEEYGDCILWTGATSNRGHPIYKPYGCPCTLVRRAVFSLTIGPLVPRQPIDTTCEERRCINPAHLARSTTQKIAQKAGARGAWSGLARKAKIAATKRGQMKLTLEQARSIRASTETGPVLAARYGVNKSLVNNIKRGVAWREYSSPFAGLLV